MGEISKKYKVNGSMNHWTFDIEFPEDADLASKALLMGASMLAVNTVWSEGFLYKVALPELKISPIMYFVIHNSVVLSKILKIIVPLV